MTTIVLEGSGPLTCADCGADWVKEEKHTSACEAKSAVRGRLRGAAEMALYAALDKAAKAGQTTARPEDAENILIHLGQLPKATRALSNFLLSDLHEMAESKRRWREWRDREVPIN